jgi:Zn-dependent protease
MSQLVEQVSGGANGLAAFLAKGLSVLVMLNVLLGTFNLFPLPPLDGSSAVLGLLPRDLADRVGTVMRGGAFSIIGLLVAWRLFRYIAAPLFGLVWRSLYPAS